jgi:hypothetical protein
MRVSAGIPLSFAGLLLAAFTGAASAQVGVFSVMRDAPVTHFSKADMNTMTATVYKTLDSGTDGVAATWDNPATRSGGSATPVADPTARKGCRVLQVENRWRTTSGKGDYLFCRNTAGKSPPWQLVSPWPK